MSGRSHNPPSGRPVTVMLSSGSPLPASLEIKDEKGRIVERYTPSGLALAERAITADLVKAVKLCLLCFHVHWPTRPPLSDAKPEVVGRLKALVAKAETLIGEKVEDPAPPCIDLPFRAAASENDRDGG